MNEFTWNPETLKVDNKWLKKGGNYYDSTVKQFRDLGLDTEDCLDSLVTKGIDEKGEAREG